jgi:PilZ domain
MLENDDAMNRIARLNTRVMLPEDFFAKQNGPTPTCWEDLRQFPRYNFRSAAALEVQHSLPAVERSGQAERVFVKDISRTAVAILHAEQLFPGERIWLTVSDGVRRGATVARCRRVQKGCFEVAACFDAAE